MKETIGAFVGFAILTIFVLGLAVGVWAIASCCEANAFESVTGRSVSTWDAMWIELRVQDAAP